MTPRSEAIAFRIWALSEAQSWDLTLREAATELGISYRAAVRVCQAKGWSSRFRVTPSRTYRDGYAPLQESVDHPSTVDQIKGLL